MQACSVAVVVRLLVLALLSLLALLSILASPLILALPLILAVVVAFGAVHLQVLAKALNVPATPRGVVRDAELGDRRAVQPAAHY